MEVSRKRVREESEERERMGREQRGEKKSEGKQISCNRREKEREKPFEKVERKSTWEEKWRKKRGVDRQIETVGEGRDKGPRSYEGKRKDTERNVQECKGPSSGNKTNDPSKTDWGLL